MMEHVGAELERSAQRHQMAEGVLAARVLEETRRILQDFFGSDADRFFSPLAFRRGELRIGVSNPPAGTALRQREQSLLEKLNTALPRARAERVVYLPRLTGRSP